MKLLVCTQAVDGEDPFSSFFLEWIVQLSRFFEAIHVVCLKEGEHALPANVSVHSLGKEKLGGRRSFKRLIYIVRLWSFITRFRSDYDAVFVHQSQEFILAAGVFWKFFRTPIYLWRNHYAGSLLTDIAAFLCTRVFCTSRFSYTAKYKKTTLMPVGVDTDLFRDAGLSARTPRSILFFGRFAPSKNPDMLLEALAVLRDAGVPFTASFYGTPLPGDEQFKSKQIVRVQELHLHDLVHVYPGVTHKEAPAIFSRHEIYVNLSSSGMYDKTIFEAAAGGCLVLTASKDFAERIGSDVVSTSHDPKDVASALNILLSLPGDEKQSLRSKLKSAAEENSLLTLTRCLVVEIRENGI